MNIIDHSSMNYDKLRCLDKNTLYSFNKLVLENTISKKIKSCKSTEMQQSLNKMYSRQVLSSLDKEQLLDFIFDLETSRVDKALQCDTSFDYNKLLSTLSKDELCEFFMEESCEICDRVILNLI